MNLPPQAFPERLVRRRQDVGGWNEYGEFIPGAVVEIPLRASIEPLGLEAELDLRGPSHPGSTAVHRLKVYISEPDALRAAWEDRGGDTVLAGGVEYTVEQSHSWRGSHTVATLVRSGGPNAAPSSPATRADVFRWGTDKLLW